jgi:hypothetical protein
MRAAPMDSYLALLRVGFTLPLTVTSSAVRSYRTLSPLPVYLSVKINKLRRSTLCCTCRRLAPPRRYLAPCPMEPGLSSNNEPKLLPAIAWPTLAISLLCPTQIASTARRIIANKRACHHCRFSDSRLARENGSRNRYRGFAPVF